jgi:hypothetical protein
VRTRLGQQQLGVRAVAAAVAAICGCRLHNRLHHLRRGELRERQRDGAIIRLQRELPARMRVGEGAQASERQPLVRHARLRRRARLLRGRRGRAAPLRRGVEPGRGLGVAHVRRAQPKEGGLWLVRPVVQS